MRNGWRVRRRIAGLAFVSALATVFAASAMGTSPTLAWLGGIYLGLTAAAIGAPTVIVAQVALGQVIAASLLVAGDGSPVLLLVPIIAGVIATAELLAITARMASPLDYRPGRDLRRAAAAVLIGAVVFTGVSAVRGAPGPTGLAAIGLASAACIGIALLLVRDGAPSARPPTARPPQAPPVPGSRHPVTRGWPASVDRG